MTSSNIRFFIQSSIDNNRKATGEKQKDSGAKTDKIGKWIENLMNKFDNPSPKNMDTKTPKILSLWST